MQTLRRLDEKLGFVPASVVTQLGRISACQGREELHRRQRASVLDRLVQVARIQSAESSNAIEGVVAPPARIKELMAERTDPRNRPEAEIAGYRSVLDLVHRSAEHMPLTPNVVLQLHHDLYQFTGIPAGAWKTSDNHIEETHRDGTKTVLFRTVAFGDTPAAMTELHDRTRTAREEGRHHQLLIIGAYVLDFLSIHPFLDGNGRMSRLLTLMLLYQAGYGVGRYISLERVVESTKESYYDTLQLSSRGWHEGDHDPWPWLEYFLGVVLASYEQFEEQAGALGGRGSKIEAIEKFIAELPSGALFRIADVRRIAVGASDSYINKSLVRLRDDGVIVRRSAGRTASWEKL
jgi:Fic family protein